VTECLPTIRASIAATNTLIDRSDSDDDDEDGANDLLKLRTRRKKGKGKKTNKVVHPAKLLLGDPTFVDLILKACKVLSYFRRNREAADLVLQIDGWTKSDKSVVRLHEDSVEVMDEINLMAAGIAYNVGDYEMAYKYIRPVVALRPHSFEEVHLLNRILIKIEFHNKGVRYMERELDKHPDSVPLRILVGHAFLMHQNYDYAMDQYGQVVRDPRYTHNPTVNLFMGIASLQKAMLRRTKDRHHGIAKSFAFFLHYYRLRKGDAEAAYNLARAYHFLGLLPYATQYYEEVLERGNKGDISLQREAAHNLAVIYTQSGSHELARRLYEEYCTV
jgi:general transcription factor 3C polypeptide 3 (transcription factor C subunit 4)